MKNSEEPTSSGGKMDCAISGDTKDLAGSYSAPKLVALGPIQDLVRAAPQVGSDVGGGAVDSHA